ncbi:ABC transporter substrate-binding protein [Mangrovicoccus ximenensis]|uniref:ABC transporter substrate-binding protein n=1 Tax=Mangrovicoccus ximenensis TaxID=1911570 RepID=UPI000D3BAF29
MTLLRSSLALLLATAAMAQAEGPDLVLAIGGEPETGFDPLLGWGSYGNPLFQSTLLKRDAALETAPDLATDWQLSEDRLTWTVTIRGDARFSDGTALTARDVAFTFNAAREAAGGLDLQVMERAEALDERTLEITLKRPWITFAEAFYTLGIVPADSYGPDYGRHPVGSGPYRLVSWQEGEQLIVAPNEAYYGKAAPFGQITFLFTGEDAGLAAARAGAVDLVSVPAQMAHALPEGFHAVRVRTVDNRGLSLPVLPPQERDGQRVGNAVTSDPAVRRAMNAGLGRRRCPACGEGRILHGYLKVNAACPACGEDLHHHRADDGPAYLTILIVGHVLAPVMLAVWELWRPAPLVMAGSLSLLTVGLALWLLPRIKGALIAIQWSKRMHGFGGADRPVADA